MLDFEKKAIFEPEIIFIDQDKYIKKQMFEYWIRLYYEVVFVDNGSEKFIGEYEREDNRIEVAYSNGKILVYKNEYNFVQKRMCLTKVFDLYNINDDTFYACTEEEALNIFNSNLDSSFLNNKGNFLMRADVEKKKRLLYKKANNFDVV